MKIKYNIIYHYGNWCGFLNRDLGWWSPETGKVDVKKKLELINNEAKWMKESDLPNSLTFNKVKRIHDVEGWGESEI